MSSYPPPSAPPRNPDPRPLPDGWVTQFDESYRTWFYVNTRVDPPAITWEHPLGPPNGPPPPPSYDTKPGSGPGFPENNPRPNSEGPQDRGLFSAGAGAGVGALGGFALAKIMDHKKQNNNNHHNQGPSYSSPPPPQQGYGPPSQGYGPPPQGYYPPPQGYYPPPPQGYGPPPGAYGGYPGYGPPPPQQVVVVKEEQNRKSGSGPGMGTALLAGGAGLVGGALLMDAIDDREDEAYDAGYDQGYDDGGGDW